MKKLLLLLLLSPVFCKAQILTNQKDKFTGKVIKAGIVNLGRTLAPSGMSLGFGTIEDKTYVLLNWPMDAGAFGALNGANVAEMSLLFKMDDGSIYKFKADSVKSKILNMGTKTYLSIGSEISTEQLKFMADHLVSDLRLGIKNDNGVDMIDALFTDKNRQQLKKAAAYMLQN